MKIANPIAKLGEDLACDYLRSKGYKIIERNFRQKYQEVDIVAIKNSILVFVEVKTRRSNSFGSPFDAIAHWKLNHLVRLAQFYKKLHPNLPEDIRIDAVGIILTQENKLESIEHLENISGF